MIVVTYLIDTFTERVDDGAFKIFSLLPIWL